MSKPIQIRICEHYKCEEYRQYEQYLIQSDKIPMNAWFAIKDFDGKTKRISFELGILEEYFLHLLQSKRCRRIAGVTLREIKKWLRVFKEWEKKFEECDKISYLKGIEWERNVGFRQE